MLLRIRKRENARVHILPFACEIQAVFFTSVPFLFAKKQEDFLTSVYTQPAFWKGVWENPRSGERRLFKWRLRAWHPCVFAARNTRPASAWTRGVIKMKGWPPFIASRKLVRHFLTARKERFPQIIFLHTLPEEGGCFERP